MPELRHHRSSINGINLLCSINGINLHYVTAGTGPLVVLLHGFPEFWISWRLQIPALVDAGFRVVAPDLRGYGQSDRPRGVAAYRMELLMDDLVGLVAHLGEEKAHFVGHDWGGVIAWNLSVHRPTVVNHLAILNAPHPVLFEQALRTWKQQRRSWYIFWFQIPYLPEAMAFWTNYRFLGTILRQDPVHAGSFSEEDIQEYQEAIRQPGMLTAALNYYRAAFRYGRGQKAYRMPPTVQPTLVIWGQQDRYLGEELLEGLSDWVPDLEILRIPDSSHWVQRDAAGQVNVSLVKLFTLRKRF